MVKSVRCLLLILTVVAGLSCAEAKQPSDRKCDAALEDISPKERKPDVWEPFVYPHECLFSAKQDDTVSLKFDVTPDGDTTNISVTRSTNNCLNAPSVRVIERWKYFCAPAGLRNVETTAAYELDRELPGAGFEREAGCVIFDRSKQTAEKILANPRLGTSCQASVDYPVRCVRKADEEEHVELKFDVTPKGKVKHIDIVESTNGCFNHRARSTISVRKYSATESGYKDIGALIYFDKASTPQTPECQPVASAGKRTKTTDDENTAPRLICSSAPVYPAQCKRLAKKKEIVSFRVWVSPAGTVERISLKDTSNDCFVAAARAAVSNYKYERTKEGAEGLVTMITFGLPR